MELTEELKKIKKIYGEKFMHLCRELFPTILEVEGKLVEILSQSFGNNSRTLYQDIVNNGLEDELKNYVYSKIDMEDSLRKFIKKKTPYELLEEAGYSLMECKTEEEIQSFKKYYAPGEELCTFNGGRLDKCEVFFAVRKDVDEIKRENFTVPDKDDKYSTSVLGIQFNREGLCTVNIISRYNHRVDNPNATYGNNLEKITPGLTQSFADLLAERGLELNNSNIENFAIPGYVVAGDGRYYKYNIEKDGIYYCPGNIVIENGEVKQLKDNEILIDDFVLDTKEKTLKEYREGREGKDSFVDAFTDIERIEVTKNKEKGIRTITINVKDNEQPITIEINSNNEIIGYSNHDLRSVGNGCMKENKMLKALDIPQLQTAGNDFLRANWRLSNLELPQLHDVGHSFLGANDNISELVLPQLQTVGHNFLLWNKKIRKLELPQLQTVGGSFLVHNYGLRTLSLPQLQTVGDCFLESNYFLEELVLPNLKSVGNDFLKKNKKLNRLEAPQLESVGNEFLTENEMLEELRLPQLRSVGYDFLWRNEILNKLETPQLQSVSGGFLESNSFFGHRINKNTYSFDANVELDNSIEEINFTDIAELDKSTALTTSELGWGERIIGKIKTTVRNLFNRNDDRDSR